MPSEPGQRLTFVLIARLRPDGMSAFQAYEDAVLPLLPAFGGRLERRLRDGNGTVEVHVVSFPSDAAFQNFRNDPRRAAFAPMLEASTAEIELLPMFDVPNPAA